MIRWFKALLVGVEEKFGVLEGSSVNEKRIFPGFLLWLSVMSFFSWACTNKFTGPASPSPVPIPTSQYTLDTSFGAGGFVRDAGCIRVASDDTLWVGATNSPLAYPMEEYSKNGILLKTATTVTVGGNVYGPNYWSLGVGFDGYIYFGVGGHPGPITSGVLGLSTAYTGTVTFAGDASDLNGDFASSVAASNSCAYVLDYDNPKVLLYNFTGTGSSKTFTLNSTFGNTGSGALGAYPMNLILNSAGTTLYVADQTNNRIVEYGAAGNYLAAVTLSSEPLDVAENSSGNIFVVIELPTPFVQELNSSGVPVTTIGSSLGWPNGIALDSQGNLYVSNADPTGSSTPGVYKFKKNW